MCVNTNGCINNLIFSYSMMWKKIMQKKQTMCHFNFCLNAWVSNLDYLGADERPILVSRGRVKCSHTPTLLLALDSSMLLTLTCHTQTTVSPNACIEVAQLSNTVATSQPSGQECELGLLCVNTNSWIDTMIPNKQCWIVCVNDKCKHTTRKYYSKQ